METETITMVGTKSKTTPAKNKLLQDIEVPRTKLPKLAFNFSTVQDL
ncbi:MAG: hypothetical protein Q7T66_00645 [Herminiimonas sp.]|nr:hypothetical protein [Herminiimonas sp.]MDO9419145.1 hypothetical protein [Herminiimonas sp.]